MRWAQAGLGIMRGAARAFLICYEPVLAMKHSSWPIHPLIKTGAFPVRKVRMPKGVTMQTVYPQYPAMMRMDDDYHEQPYQMHQQPHHQQSKKTHNMGGMCSSFCSGCAGAIIGSLCSPG